MVLCARSIRSLRDDFALGLAASLPVRMIISAKAFRLWLRGRQDSDVSDDELVKITGTRGNHAAGIGNFVLLTAGVLRGVDLERSRVVRGLLSALSGEFEF